MEQDGSVMDVTFYVDESELEKLNKTENFFKDGYLVKQLNSKLKNCETDGANDTNLVWCYKHGLKVISAAPFVIKESSGIMVNV